MHIYIYIYTTLTALRLERRVVSEGDFGLGTSFHEISYRLEELQAVEVLAIGRSLKAWPPPLLLDFRSTIGRKWSTIWWPCA